MFQSTILKLTKRLYPKGRAFRVPVGGIMEKIHKALATSESNTYTNALSVLDSILPDNDNFTLSDANEWERRLGLIDNPLTSLADKKLNIARKYKHPGTIKARGHYLNLERELRSAGFNVRVTENRYLSPTLIDEQFGIAEFGISEFGGTLPNPNKYEVIDPRSFNTGLSDFGIAEFGVAEFGGGINFSLVVNEIDETTDNTFFDAMTEIEIAEFGTAEFGTAEFGGTFTYTQALRSSFFVSGETINDMANILLNRKEEFRQLILRLKPVQTVGILLVNYTNYSVLEDFNEDFNEDFAI